MIVLYPQKIRSAVEVNSKLFSRFSKSKHLKLRSFEKKNITPKKGAFLLGDAFLLGVYGIMKKEDCGAIY